MDALARPAADAEDQAPTMLAATRALIARGEHDAVERTLPVLDTVIAGATADGRDGVEIEARALEALARWQRGDRAGAMTALERALRLAEPEGYARTFIDLGLPMARMLQDAHARGVMRGTTSVLLDALGAESPRGASLPEPLSERERDVLRHLAAGLTNREIAEALYISPETVKKRTGSIYGKLGTRTRTEAVTRARSLDLLD